MRKYQASGLHEQIGVGNYFGKVANLQEAETTYAGNNIRQLSDFSFVVHMEQYIHTSMSPVTLARMVLKKDAAAAVLGEFEQTQLCGAIASLAWA